jgi:hypothetical protein
MLGRHDLSLDSTTRKIWRLIKTLNEDTTAFRGTTTLEKDGSLYTRKKAANVLAEHFKPGSMLKVPSRR